MTVASRETGRSLCKSLPPFTNVIKTPQAVGILGIGFSNVWVYTQALWKTTILQCFPLHFRRKEEKASHKVGLGKGEGKDSPAGWGKIARGLQSGLSHDDIIFGHQMSPRLGHIEWATSWFEEQTLTFMNGLTHLLLTSVVSSFWYHLELKLNWWAICNDLRIMSIWYPAHPSRNKLRWT